ncbi:uncharacterized protein LOC127748784 isoform X2 [Frankliniella occidentalis]|uniref:Uncharacterized protein LOC127748784 isoform X2 n=1 Tax=Frankliniella occidentalis TaxID=133901 RepID=A0A9C6WVF8_FRAOC|nr:uncharacterized protein LOC127748784 isoform X2 [Frankliniella occidentalis]
MEQLPDDVLLEVMRCLTVKDLFACRLVCKALGALALHPDVWRYRSFNADEDDNDNQLWQPVLRLAPCLGALYATLPPPVWGCLLVCTMTRCAVQKLSLTVYEGGCMHTAAMIRNQEGLGRLRLLKRPPKQC